MEDKELAVKLYQLKLGEGLILDEAVWDRVPGGWFYGNYTGSIFIPYDNEFIPCMECKEFMKNCTCKKDDDIPF